MVESDFGGAEGTKAIGFSQRQLQTVIKALGGTTGDRLVRPKPVEQQTFMGAQHPRYLLEGFDPGAQDVVKPAVQEVSRPKYPRPGPKQSQFLLEQIGAHRSQVGAQQVGQLDLFPRTQMLGPLQQAPARAGQDGFQALA